MKGQAVFEFIVAAVLFFAIVFYIITLLNSNVNDYSISSQLNSLETRAMEISEYLVHVNLTREWPLLSYDAINDFDVACNNDYTKTMEQLDVEPNMMMKLLVNEGNKVLLDCENTIGAPNIQKAEVERFGLSENNTILSVRVIIW